jgi:hypothetical protein
LLGSAPVAAAAAAAAAVVCRSIKWHQQRQQWWDAQRKRYRPQVWATIDKLSEYGIYTTLDFRPEMDKCVATPRRTALDIQPACGGADRIYIYTNIHIY